MLLRFDHIARYIVKELQRHVNGCDASRSRLHWRQHSLTIPQPTEWQHIGNQIDAAIIFVRAQTWCSDFVEASILNLEGTGKIPIGEVVKNVSKPSGEFNVCMGGDDGRYGWVGITKGPSPRRHRHLFARSEFHKTCTGIVDDIGGPESSTIWQSETILTRF